MEKRLKTDYVNIEFYNNLCSEAEIPIRDFGKLTAKIMEERENTLLKFPDAYNFRVSITFREERCYEYQCDAGWMDIALYFDRLETDKEFEKRTKETEESEHRAAALLEADKQNRISEAKKLLEENGYVVAR